jgi:hypothetical protein
MPAKGFADLSRKPLISALKMDYKTDFGPDFPNGRTGGFP